MTDKTPIRALIEAVEDGRGDAVGIFAKRLSSAAVDRGEYWPSHDVVLAFRGSLDAALALHEALLPGWEARPVIGGEGAGRKFWRCEVEDLGSGEEQSGDNMPNPSRAWLLAILKAYEAQQ